MCRRRKDAWERLLPLKDKGWKEKKRKNRIVTTDKSFDFCIEPSSAHLETEGKEEGDKEARDDLGRHSKANKLTLDTAGVIFPL